MVTMKGRVEQQHDGVHHGAHDIFDVGVQTHQQVAGAEAVKIGKGKVSNLAIQLGTQDVGGALGEEDGIGGRAGHGQTGDDGQDNHDQAGLQNNFDVIGWPMPSLISRCVSVATPIMHRAEMNK